MKQVLPAMLKTGKVSKIRYTKANGASSERTILTTNMTVRPAAKAIDVSDLSPREVHELAELHSGYLKYAKAHYNSMFSFEDWVSHTTGQTVEPKWRTFLLDNVEEL